MSLRLKYFMAKLRLTIIQILRRLADFFGGVLLSKQIHQQILLQRAHAVAELVAVEKAELKQGLNCVVFSKDRAMQLYTLLHTYFDCVKNPVPVFVIYSVSNEAHAQAYREVEAAFATNSVAVTFVPDGQNFRDSLLSVLAQIRVTSIFFLVDDIIFIRPLDLGIAAAIDPQCTILSLRHSPYLRRSYTANVSQQPPDFSPTKISPDLLAFNWFEQGHEWSDPWSVDGQILSTAEVRVLTRISQFKAPNSYEVALKTFNDIAMGRGGTCFKESKILNLPINRVQSEINNLCGSVSSDFLLEQWNKGLMIDAGMFDDHIPLSPHEEHAITFKMRA